MIQVKPLIVGTAGHIDHGKTMLIKALTGIQTDRLKVEIQRGMSIELGYAYLDFAQAGRNYRVGIIDVPGHLRFIRTMIAGATSIDFLLLVVAADEGVMPQTTEHLQIAELLAIPTGLVVITKIDRVPPEQVDECETQIKSCLRGTFLAGRPIHRVSSLSGQGISQLRQDLAKQIARARTSKADYPVRLHIDRVFTIKGTGVVVTGTCLSGHIRRNDTLYVYPQGRKCRVKGIQVHNMDMPCVQGGQRAALNLKGTGRELQRGQTLAGKDHVFPCKRLDCTIRSLAAFPEKHSLAVRFLSGTREIAARLTRSKRDPGMGRLLLAEPAFLCRGDRFILRHLTNAATIGGGCVLNTRPPVKSVNRADTLRLTRLLQAPPSQAVLLDYVRWHTKGAAFAKLRRVFPLEPQALRAMLAHKDIRYVATLQRYVHSRHFAGLQARIMADLRAAPGQALAYNGLVNSLKERHGAPLAAFALAEMAKSAAVSIDGSTVRLPRPPSRRDKQEQKLLAEIENQLAGKVVMLDVRELRPEQRTCIVGLEPRQMRNLLLLQKRLLIHRQTVARMKEWLLAFFAGHRVLRVGDFKQAFSLSRKYAIPILEYFDSQQITFRKEGIRYLNQKISKK